MDRTTAASSHCASNQASYFIDRMGSVGRKSSLLLNLFWPNARSARGNFRCANGLSVCSLVPFNTVYNTSGHRAISKLGKSDNLEK